MERSLPQRSLYGHPCVARFVHISNFTLGNAHAAARLLAARPYLGRDAALLVVLPRPLRKPGVARRRKWLRQRSAQ